MVGPLNDWFTDLPNVNRDHKKQNFVVPFDSTLKVSMDGFIRLGQKTYNFVFYRNGD